MASGGGRKRNDNKKELTKVINEDVTLGDATFTLAATSLSARFDDPVYQANRDVWENVTRGGCNVFVKETAEGAAAAAPRLVGAMCGTRKFGYWEDKAYGNREAAHHIVAMEKENGENAQIAAFVHRGVRYWLVGSKNVPLLARHSHFLEDLAAPVYAKERYQFARKIADLFYRTVLTRGQYAPIGEAAAAAGSADAGGTAAAVSAVDLHEELATHRWTAVVEAIFLDSQHIVAYERDTLRAFALTQPGKPSAEGLTALLPAQALDFFRRHGIETARIVGEADIYAAGGAGAGAAATMPPAETSMAGAGAAEAATGLTPWAGADATPSSDAASGNSAAAGASVAVSSGSKTAPPARPFAAEYTALCDSIGRLDNSEGAVAYALDASGSRVVYMYKVKSYQYVIARRARQIILGGLPDGALTPRLLELAKFGVPVDMIRERLPYFLRFAPWLRRQKAFREVFTPAGAASAAAAAPSAGGAGAKPAVNRRGAYSLQQQWVTFNKAFAEASAAGTTAAAAGEEDAAGSGSASLQQSSVNNGKVVIMLQGLPLTGKSTLARQLLVLMRRAGHVPRWLNQDEVAEGKGGKRANYLRLLEEAVADPGVTHIILDKSNINRENVDDYTDRGILPSVTIRMRHPDDAPGALTKLVELCRERFFKRGAGHRTLKAPAAAGAAGPASAGAGSAAAGSAATSDASTTTTAGVKRKWPAGAAAPAAAGESKRDGATAAGAAAEGDGGWDDSTGMAAEMKAMFGNPSSGPAAGAAAGKGWKAGGMDTGDDDDAAAWGEEAGGDDGGGEWTAVGSTAGKGGKGGKPQLSKAERKAAAREAANASKAAGRWGGKGSDAPDIDAVLGAFAGIDGAAAICGGVSELTQYDDDGGSGAGLTVNHSVIQEPEEALVTIWSLLASNGLVSERLSPLRDHPAALGDAIRLSEAYERYLAHTAPPPTRLWGVAFDEPARQRLLALVPPAVPLRAKLPSGAPVPAAAAGGAGAAAGPAEDAGVTPLSAVHHTIWYTGGAADHEAELKYGPRLAAGDTAMTVRVLGIAWDDRCVAAVCDRSASDSLNAHPHITLALGRGTRPVYSNEMLARYFGAGGAADSAAASTGAADAGSPPSPSAAGSRNGVNYTPVGDGGVMLHGRLARNPA